MGVVVRQGLKYTAVSYAFMIASIIATLFLYPLNLDLYGSFIFFLDTAGLFVPLAVLGFSGVALKFFPEQKATTDSGRVIFNSGMLVIGITSLTSLILYLVFYPFLKELISEKSDYLSIKNLIWVFIPLLALIAVLNFLMAYISNFKRVALPKLIQHLVRISLPIIFFLSYAEVITPATGLILLLVHYAISVIILMIYLNGLEAIQFDFSKSVRQFAMRRDVRVFAFFGLLSSLGSTLAFKLDTFIITLLLDTDYTGTYSIGNRIGNVIAIPTSAIIAISAPIISAAMNNKDYKAVDTHYKRSSEILTVAGVFLICGLAVIATYLFEIMPDGQSMVENGALTVVFLIAFSRFLDMITSVNSQIISFSKYFRYNLVFLVLLAVLNVVMNLLFIPEFGIVGASLATFISLATFNLAKIIFIRTRHGMWPFTWRSLVIIGTGVLCVFLVGLFDRLTTFNTLLSILFNGLLLSLLLFAALYFFRLSPDFSNFVRMIARRITNTIRSAGNSSSK